MSGATPPLARSGAEARVYLASQPCEGCGSTAFDPEAAVLEEGGVLVSVYQGGCPGCGRPRQFTFRLPDGPDGLLFPDPDEPGFGAGDRPSELLDPGEWQWLADAVGRSCPAVQDGLDADQRRTARVDLRTAAAAVTEVLKFFPVGAEALGPDAFWSERGREVYRHEPGRFRRGRLEVARDTYRGIADRFAASPRATRPDPAETS
jgi:hypothetical protein